MSGFAAGGGPTSAAMLSDLLAIRAGVVPQPFGRGLSRPVVPPAATRIKIAVSGATKSQVDFIVRSSGWHHERPVLVGESGRAIVFVSELVTASEADAAIASAAGVSWFARLCPDGDKASKAGKVPDEASPATPGSRLAVAASWAWFSAAALACTLTRVFV